MAHKTSTILFTLFIIVVFNISCKSEAKKQQERQTQELFNTIDEIMGKEGKPLTAPQTVVCPYCEGTGCDICSYCNGTGELIKTIKVKPKDCEVCSGKGKIYTSDGGSVECGFCDGTGKEKSMNNDLLLNSDESEFQIRIKCEYCKGNKFNCNKPCKACLGKGKLIKDPASDSLFPITE